MSRFAETTLFYVGLIVILILVLMLANLLVGFALRTTEMPSDDALAEARSPARQVRRLLSFGVMVLVSLLSIVIVTWVTWEWVTLHTVLEDGAVASDAYSRAVNDELYGGDADVEVQPGLELEGDEFPLLTTGYPRQNDQFVLEATLKQTRQREPSCTPKDVSDLLARSTVTLNTLDSVQVSRASVHTGWLTESAESLWNSTKKLASPYGVCGIKWRWLATTSSSGRIGAVIQLVYTTPSGPLHVAKLIPFGVGSLAPIDLSNITSIVTALLSLVGVLLAAWIGSRQRFSDGR